MIHYKKAVYITLIEFVVVLAITVTYAWFYYGGVQFEKIAVASLFFCAVALVGSYFLIESQTKIVAFIFSVLIIATYMIDYILQSISNQIFVFLVTACIITIFLNPRYVLVFGAVTFLMQILFSVFYYSRISETFNPYQYFIYLVCYAFGIGNMYLLVKQAKKSMDCMEDVNRSKNNFLAAMAHEIRTPMNAILSLSEEILYHQEPEVIFEHTEKIINAGNILLSMTNGILDYALIESGKYAINQTSYQLDSIIDDAVEMTSVQLLDKKLKFVLKKETGIPIWLYGDEMRIRQILINILSNAAKYTESGRITMKVRWEDEKPNESGTLIFIINDTGCGIKKGDLEKIFHSFTRLSYGPKVPGTGLGLKVCRELITLLGGEITVESEYGAGSTFTIIIPQKVYRKDKIIKAPEAKILIVEDTKVNSLLLERLLEIYEAKVEIAKDGQECLEKMKASSYDLIIMDYLMPEMDGLETVRAIHESIAEASKKVPIVVLSTSDENKLRNEFIEAGCQDYLEKPIEIEKLEYIIRNYLPKHLLMEDQILMD